MTTTRSPAVSATRAGSSSGHGGGAPLYRPGADAAGFADLFSLGDVDHILSSTTPRFPAFRMVKEGSGSTRGPTPGRGGSVASPCSTWPTRDACTSCSMAAPPSCCRACTASGRRWPASAATRSSP